MPLAHVFAFIAVTIAAYVLIYHLLRRLFSGVNSARKPQRPGTHRVILDMHPADVELVVQLAYQAGTSLPGLVYGLIRFAAVEHREESDN